MQRYGSYRHNAPVIVLILIGLVAGLFSALFGVGGGIIAVPLMLLTGRFAERSAMATSLAAISITAAVGTVTYGIHGEVRVAEALLVGLPAAGGAILGATWQQRVPQRRLSYLFALMLLGIGISMLVDRAGAEGGDLHLGAGPVAAAIAIGFVAGILAGMFGVGGGIIFVPALTLVIGMGQLEAEATSLLAVLPTVASGVWRQRRYGNIQWKAAVVLGVASVAGVQGGVHIALNISETLLRTLFGILLMGVAAQVAHRAWRKGQAEARAAAEAAAADPLADGSVPAAAPR